jgi:hypothetical protein
MARSRYFPGKQLPWLEQKLGLVLEELASGTTITSWGEGDSSASKATHLSAMERKRMLINDLNLLDPANYPLEDTAPVSKVRVNFNGLDL